MSRGFDDRGPKGRPNEGRRPAPDGRAGGKPRGPKPLADILGDLFAARGLARVQALGELEAAWSVAVGEVGRRHTKVDGLRRGVLSVTVAHPTLLAELATFQKSSLLASLRQSMAGTPILDIRFRVGSIAPESTKSGSEPDRDEPPTKPSPHPKPKPPPRTGRGRP